MIVGSSDPWDKPRSYEKYIDLVRHAERAMGDGVKRDGAENEAERDMAKYRVKG